MMDHFADAFEKGGFKVKKKSQKVPKRDFSGLFVKENNKRIRVLTDAERTITA